jgi:hypothetical protein
LIGEEGFSRLARSGELAKQGNTHQLMVVVMVVVMVFVERERERKRIRFVWKKFSGLVQFGLDLETLIPLFLERSVRFYYTP